MPRKFLEHNFDSRLKDSEDKLNKLIAKEADVEEINKQKEIVASMKRRRPSILLSQIGGNILLIPLTSKKPKLGLEKTHYPIGIMHNDKEVYAKVSLPVVMCIKEFNKYKGVDTTKNAPNISFDLRNKIKKALINNIDEENSFIIEKFGIDNTKESINDTIYSLVTKEINQNVGIIRISGPRAFEVTSKLVDNFYPEKNKVINIDIKINNKFIDNALVLSFINPNSFTGEDIVEIQTHGSMFIIKKIISELNKQGIRQSHPGEFMKQAYINGKIDLSQSEAINTLIVSENKTLTERSLSNLRGEQSEYITKTLDSLSKIVSRIQVSIDYPENTDLPEFNIKEIGKSISLLQNEIENIINDSQRLVKFSEGITISIIGIPNAGKSSLLNKLISEDRAIVSDIEGTTRDIVDSTLYIDGVKVTIKDTAGIRKKTDNAIEREGINRSINTAKESDIVLLLLDGTKDKEEQKKEFIDIIKNLKNNLIVVTTKSDLKTNEGLNITVEDNSYKIVLDEISKMIKNNIFDEKKNTNSLLITQSQIDNFKQINNSLLSALAFINANETEDVIAFELENAMKILGKIIGKEINQDYLTNLFASFCIGK